jgi:hypothetical protein
MMRSQLLVVALSAAVVAQTPAPQPRPRFELAKALQQVDMLLQQAKALEEAADRARALAKAAETQAKQAEVEPIVKGAAALQEKLDAVRAALLPQLGALQELRTRLAEEAPDSLVAEDPVRAQVLAAIRLPSPVDGEAALVKLEPQVGVEWVGLVRFETAEMIRQQATAAIKANNMHKAEDLLLRACRKFNDVLAVADCTDSSEGSSLHAIATRRVVLIQNQLYAAYRELSEKQPGAHAYADAAKKYRTAAEEAFQRLRRAYPDATMPDGQRVVDVTRAEVSGR